MKKIKLARAAWKRKPQTQVVPNKKALGRKYSCRLKGDKNVEP